MPNQPYYQYQQQMNMVHPDLQIGGAPVIQPMTQQQIDARVQDSSAVIDA